MKSNRVFRRFPAAPSFILLPLLCASCGGPQTASDSGRGAIQFTITWPDAEASRLIPVASASLEFRVLEKRPDENQDEPVVLASKVVTRPPVGVTTTQVTLSDLPSVHITVRINARPSADGSGIPQASGSVDLKVPERGTIDASVTLRSTITSIVINGALAPIPVGENVILGASAYDAAGGIVLTSPGKWQWSVADATVADGNPNGDLFNLTAKKVGATRVTAIEQESGKQASVTVTVVASGGGGITPIEEIYGNYRVNYTITGGYPSPEFGVYNDRFRIFKGADGGSYLDDGFRFVNALVRLTFTSPTTFTGQSIGGAPSQLQGTHLGPGTRQLRITGTTDWGTFRTDFVLNCVRVD